MHGTSACMGLCVLACGNLVARSLGAAPRARVAKVLEGVKPAVSNRTNTEHAIGKDANDDVPTRVAR